MATVLKGKHFSEGVNRASVEVFNWEDVASRAKDYLATVREQANALIETARRESQEIRQQAIREGIEAGSSRIEAEADSRATQIAEGRIQQASEQIRALGEQLEYSTEQWLRQWQHETIPLAIAIAERLVRRQVDADPEILLQWLQDAIRMIQTDEKISVRIHPKQMAILGESLKKTLAQLHSNRTLEIVADESIEDHGLVLHTSEARVDLQLQTQLNRLMEELQ